MTLNEESKVKLFTHNDLDGIGNEILARLAFENVDVTIVRNPQHASEAVLEFIRSKEFEEFEAVFITDISVSNDVAVHVDEFIGDKVKLLDHHGTASYLNEYSWATVEVGKGTSKNAGTSMFYTYLANRGFFQTEPYKVALIAFVEKIRRYDTWLWKTHYRDQNAMQLNNLFFLLGREKFVSNILNKFNKLPRFSVREGEWLEMFDGFDIAVIRMDKDNKDRYFEKKAKQMFEADFLGWKVGVVYADQYISELGNYLSETNPHLRFIMMIDIATSKVSLRTIHDDIDLGKDVAQKFGGGGHRQASGFSYNAEAPQLIFPIITSQSYDKLSTRINKLVNKEGFIGKLTKLIDKIKK